MALPRSFRALGRARRLRPATVVLLLCRGLPPVAGPAEGCSGGNTLAPAAPGALLPVEVGQGATVGVAEVLAPHVRSPAGLLPDCPRTAPSGRGGDPVVGESSSAVPGAPTPGGRDFAALLASRLDWLAPLAACQSSWACRVPSPGPVAPRTAVRLMAGVGAEPPVVRARRPAAGRDDQPAARRPRVEAGHGATKAVAAT